ncbi:MaoC family dehydratase [Spelaeicoccus albus]|uniref:Acyl dehydratase n=1 Tax=Spelaeicoccus albus TaxID=1280376 RepID=A0A7Z0D3K4_9MICO|nr:MaoC family dehydratase [Spelaeicoccus albus]NYI68198.1 acyl dehydratase [Spelaeicoccus albus]
MSKPTTGMIGGEDFAVPITDRYFEDYEPGRTFRYGYVVMDEGDMLAFARRYDPQPFHVDPAAAEESYFGGLIASGWHTSSILMRLYADHYLTRVASLGSPGIDELRWPAPVRPGDRLHLKVRVAEARLSRSKPDRGIVRTDAAMINQDDVAVLTLTAVNLIYTRASHAG